MFDRCLYFNTNKLARIVGKIWTKSYKELGLAPAHAYLLRLVLEQPGLSQKEIGALLYLEKSTITRFVDKMVEEGYLIRNPGEDTKSSIIMPTNKTKTIENRLNQIGNELYGRMQKHISPDDLKDLVALLKHASHQL